MKRRKPKLKWVKNCVSERGLWLGPELRWDTLVCTDETRLSSTSARLLLPFLHSLPIPSRLTFQAFFASSPLLGTPGTKDAAYSDNFSRSPEGAHELIGESLSSEGQKCKKPQLFWKMKGEQLLWLCLSPWPKSLLTFVLLLPSYLAFIKKMLFPNDFLLCSRRFPIYLGPKESIWYLDHLLCPLVL